MGTTSNFALRLPASLKHSVEQVARDDGTSLNQFIVTAIAEKLAAIKTAVYFQERAKRGNLFFGRQCLIVISISQLL